MGVHVRLPDGSEDVYVDEFKRGYGRTPFSEVPDVEHYYTLMKDGYVFVYRIQYGENSADVIGHRRVAIYAPGGWHRIRSKWIPIDGSREYEHLSRYE